MLLLAGALLVLAPSCRADTTDPFTLLRSAGPLDWAVLYIGTNASPTSPTVTLSAPPGAQTIITGDVGIRSGTLNVKDSRSAVHGSVYLDPAAGMPSGTTLGRITEGVYRESLSAVVGYAMDTYNAAKALQSITTQQQAVAAGVNLLPTTNIEGSKNPIVITGSAGLNLMNLTDLNVGGGGLVLNAPNTAKFVINVSGNMSTSGNTNTAGIGLTGGVLAQNVLYNVIGGPTGCSVNNPGSTPCVDFTGHIPNVSGIVLAPYRDINVGPGIIYGQLISGGNIITLQSGSTVIQAIPEPASLLLFASGTWLLAVFRRRAS